MNHKPPLGDRIPKDIGLREQTGECGSNPYDTYYDTAANKARHVLEPATWMPPCPICHSHKCRKTAEECDMARLGGPDDPMTQLDDELRGGK